ncbi:hypothetical protein [Lacticaseibacillus brantae]|uniref:hypothetical protein n=1 Tax=Lacticaseibacillus brantae TaxID=943673 RepID=UPI0012EE7A83|nr:hypothetical protein [Lacticaseibacillus brantae]
MAKEVPETTASASTEVPEGTTNTEESSTKPTDADTVATIKAYLDAKGILYQTNDTKLDLLALVV